MDALRKILYNRQKGMKFCGIPSFCTANELVIEACIRQAARFNDYVLIEATANQVNQYGGYTGMKPADFRDFVYEIADRNGFDRDRIILGGDHLGPLTWQNEPEASAMAKSVELVKLFVSAGFKKIHLDTSMRVADDPRDEPLTDETIARRGAVLYKACEEAYQERLKTHPGEARPAFIIGSEVPIPGGAQEAEDSIAVTKPEAVEKTLQAYRDQFEKQGIHDAFHNIIGIVVQPGVEFGDEEIFHYNRQNASALTAFMKSHPLKLYWKGIRQTTSLPRSAPSDGGGRHCHSQSRPCADIFSPGRALRSVHDGSTACTGRKAGAFPGSAGKGYASGSCQLAEALSRQ